MYRQRLRGGHRIGMKANDPVQDNAQENPPPQVSSLNLQYNTFNQSQQQHHNYDSWELSDNKDKDQNDPAAQVETVNNLRHYGVPNSQALSLSESDYARTSQFSYQMVENPSINQLIASNQSFGKQSFNNYNYEYNTSQNPPFNQACHSHASVPHAVNNQPTDRQTFYNQLSQQQMLESQAYTQSISSSYPPPGHEVQSYSYTNPNAEYNFHQQNEDWGWGNNDNWEEWDNEAEVMPNSCNQRDSNVVTNITDMSHEMHGENNSLSHKSNDKSEHKLVSSDIDKQDRQISYSQFYNFQNARVENIQNSMNNHKLEGSNDNSVYSVERNQITSSEHSVTNDISILQCDVNKEENEFSNIIKSVQENKLEYSASPLYKYEINATVETDEHKESNNELRGNYCNSVLQDTLMLPHSYETLGEKMDNINSLNDNCSSIVSNDDINDNGASTVCNVDNSCILERSDKHYTSKDECYSNEFMAMESKNSYRTFSQEINDVPNDIVSDNESSTTVENSAHIEGLEANFNDSVHPTTDNLQRDAGIMSHLPSNNVTKENENINLVDLSDENNSNTVSCGSEIMFTDFTFLPQDPEIRATHLSNIKFSGNIMHMPYYDGNTEDVNNRGHRLLVPINDHGCADSQADNAINSFTCQNAPNFEPVNNTEEAGANVIQCDNNNNNSNINNTEDNIYTFQNNNLLSGSVTISNSNILENASLNEEIYDKLENIHLERDQLTTSCLNTNIEISSNEAISSEESLHFQGAVATDDLYGKQKSDNELSHSVDHILKDSHPVSYSLPVSVTDVTKIEPIIENSLHISENLPLLSNAVKNKDKLLHVKYGPSGPVSDISYREGSPFKPPVCHAVGNLYTKVKSAVGNIDSKNKCNLSDDYSVDTNANPLFLNGDSLQNSLKLSTTISQVCTSDNLMATSEVQLLKCEQLSSLKSFTHILDVQPFDKTGEHVDLPSTDTSSRDSPNYRMVPGGLSKSTSTTLNASQSGVPQVIPAMPSERVVTGNDDPQSPQMTRIKQESTKIRAPPDGPGCNDMINNTSSVIPPVRCETIGSEEPSSRNYPSFMPPPSSYADHNLTWDSERYKERTHGRIDSPHSHRSHDHEHEQYYRERTRDHYISDEETYKYYDRRDRKETLYREDMERYKDLKEEKYRRRRELNRSLQNRDYSHEFGHDQEEDPYYNYCDRSRPTSRSSSGNNLDRTGYDQSFASNKDSYYMQHDYRGHPDDARSFSRYKSDYYYKAGAPRHHRPKDRYNGVPHYGEHYDFRDVYGPHSYYYYYQKYYENHPYYREYYRQFFKQCGYPTAPYSEERNNFQSGRSSVNEELKKSSLSRSYRDLYDPYGTYYQQQLRSYESSTRLHDTSDGMLLGYEPSIYSDVSHHQTILQSFVSGVPSIVGDAAVEPQIHRMTPLQHSTSHIVARFSSNGNLMIVLPRSPKDEEKPVVEIQAIRKILMSDAVYSGIAGAHTNFPGPLIQNDTHKDVVIRYCMEKSLEVSKSSRYDKGSEILLWEYLALLVRQNGQVCGADVAGLLVKRCETSNNKFLDADENMPAKRIGFDNYSSEELISKFTEYVCMGRKKDAIDLAVKEGLWSYALALSAKMDSGIHAHVLSEFINSFAPSCVLHTAFQQLSGKRPDITKNYIPEKYGDWMQHVATMISNSSGNYNRDKVSLLALADNLLSRDCIFAAHFCYLMAEETLGNYGNSETKIVLLGSSNFLPFEVFSSSEAIQCTEIYEYAQGLSSNSLFVEGFQFYKYIYALRLAECGFCAKALRYCFIIGQAICSNPSAYSLQFINNVKELSEKLKFYDNHYQMGGELLEMSDPPWLSLLKQSQEMLHYQLVNAQQGPSHGEEQNCVSTENVSATSMIYNEPVIQSEPASLQQAYQPVDEGPLSLGILPVTDTVDLTNFSNSPQVMPETSISENIVSNDNSHAADNVPPSVNESVCASPPPPSMWKPVDTVHEPPSLQDQRPMSGELSPEEQQYYEMMSVKKKPVLNYDNGGIQHFKNKSASRSLISNAAVNKKLVFKGSYPIDAPVSIRERGCQKTFQVDTLCCEPPNICQEHAKLNQNINLVRNLSGRNLDSYNSSNPTSDSESDDCGSEDIDYEAGYATKNFNLENNIGTSGTQCVSHGSETTSPPPESLTSETNEGTPENKVETKKEDDKKKSGFFSKIFKWNSTNQAKLPDDKNPTIVWDEKEKRWINKDGDDETLASTLPPPKSFAPQSNLNSHIRAGPKRSRYVEVVGDKDRQKLRLDAPPLLPVLNQPVLSTDEISGEAEDTLDSLPQPIQRTRCISESSSIDLEDIRTADIGKGSDDQHIGQPVFFNPAQFQLQEPSSIMQSRKSGPARRTFKR